VRPRDAAHAAALGCEASGPSQSVQELYLDADERAAYAGLEGLGVGLRAVHDALTSPGPMPDGSLLQRARAARAPALP
jgi:hypothetical protein